VSVPGLIPLWLWLVIDGAAAYRLWRLLAHDTFPPVARARDAVLVRYGDRWPGELLTCPWCLGWWVSVLVVAGTALVPGWWLPAAAALTLSTVVGLMAERV